jgi:hypothetical protein
MSAETPNPNLSGAGRVPQKRKGLVRAGYPDWYFRLSPELQADYRATRKVRKLVISPIEIIRKRRQP